MERILNDEFPMDMKEVKEVDYDRDNKVINVKVKMGVFDTEKYEVKLLVTRKK